MGLSINTNIASLQNNRRLDQSLNRLKKSNEELASGRRRLNPAELAIAEDLLARGDTAVVATRNISDAVSFANVAEGSLSTVSDITGRLGELAAQASNGTLSSEQRAALDQEYQQLSAELDRISQSTEFNGQKLLNGSAQVSVQAGVDGSASSQISLSLPGVSASSLGVGGTNLLTQESAQQALTQVDSARDTVSQARGEIGATVNRLGSAFNNLQTSIENTRAAESRIRDVDFADATARNTQAKILTQVGAAVGAQANLSPAVVSRLLG
ncbi:MAG: flagellin FliC [Bdellovibrionales bacterium]|nr:flagellin FliC [Bdellovibrionales bacterium]